MKKLSLLLVMSSAMIFLFSMCEQKIAKNEYLIQGVISDSAVHRIYLSYVVNDTARKVDSVDVLNGKFAFKGMLEAPRRATLSQRIRYGAAEYVELYMEPGKITVNIGEPFNKATVNSPINNDKRQWHEELAAIEKEMSALNERWQKMSKEENLSKEEQEKQSSMISQEYEALSNQVKEKSLTFIETHPDSYFALVELFQTIIGYNPDGEKAQKTFELFSEKVKSSEFGGKIKENIAKWKAIAVGSIAPDFTQNDTIGNSVSLSSFRGKYVLIDFWASWCGPCRSENPNVVNAYNQFKDKGFTVLGVSLDNNRENWLKAIASDKLAWTQVSDLGGWKNEVAALYAVRAIPVNFLIDPEGKIIERELRGKDLIDTLDKYLK